MPLTKDTRGLWCRADKTFYYLETGPVWVTNTLDRIRKILVARGLVVFDIKGTKRGEEPYLQMSVSEAREKNYEIKPIFINDFVRKNFETKQEEETSSPWDS